jgi:hypothetical protein
VLPAGAAAHERLHLDVVVLDVDLDLVGDLGNDVDGGERGLAAGVGVERADANQPVNAVLAPQVAVGVRPADREGDAADAGDFARSHVEFFEPVAPLFRPAGVHAVEHAGPVAGLGAAGPGLDGDDRRQRVRLLRHHRLEFKLFDGGRQLRQRGLDLRGEFLAEFEHRVDVAELRLEFLERFDRAVEGLQFLHRLGGALLVGPEVGRFHGLLDVRRFRRLAGDVKGTSVVRRPSCAGLRAAASNPR